MYIGDLDDPQDFDYPIWVKARGKKKDSEHGLRIEKDRGTGAIESGDVIRLVVKTGVHVDVLGSAVRARYYDQRGQWQQLTIVKQEGGVINSGDLVFIRGHQGEYIDAEPNTKDGEIKSRWRDEGDWQQII